MKRIDPSLVTPIFARAQDGDRWPEDESVFYVLAADGLFLCRNHEFFRSSVHARRWPSELATQGAFLDAAFPRPSRRRIERLVGFFDLAWQWYGGEATAFLAWNRRDERVEIIVPDQLSTVGRNRRGEPYPVGVHYRTPSRLPEDLKIFCDVHSHCDLPAYASSTDTEDEAHRTGLHAVVGKLHCEPPQFHVEAVIDGTRFLLDEKTVFGEYRRRDFDVSRAWLRNVRVKEHTWKRIRWNEDRNKDAGKRTR